MQIHATAKFSASDFKFHNSLNVDVEIEKITSLKIQITNLALQKFKEKCINHFKVKFEDMIFFEVYYFNKEAKEIEIFKKEKI